MPLFFLHFLQNDHSVSHGQQNNACNSSLNSQLNRNRRRSSWRKNYNKSPEVVHVLTLLDVASDRIPLKASLFCGRNPKKKNTRYSSSIFLRRQYFGRYRPATTTGLRQQQQHESQLPKNLPSKPL